MVQPTKKIKTETLYYYDIELRDENGKLYVNENGNKLTSRSFQFTDNSQEQFIHWICERTAGNYKAVCKKGTEINIDVRTYSELTKTYPIAYSFYGKEKRFVKH